MSKNHDGLRYQKKKKKKSDSRQMTLSINDVTYVKYFISLLVYIVNAQFMGPIIIISFVMIANNIIALTFVSLTFGLMFPVANIACVKLAHSPK